MQPRSMHYDVWAAVNRDCFADLTLCMYQYFNVMKSWPSKSLYVVASKAWVDRMFCLKQPPGTAAMAYIKTYDERPNALHEHGRRFILNFKDYCSAG